MAETNHGEGIRMESSIDVSRTTQEVFEFWRKLENFPLFMSHVKEVKAVGDNRYAWTVAGPIGTKFSWQADVIDADSPRKISWRSVENSDVDNAGEVVFVPLGEDQTRICVRLNYSPPGGAIGHAIATLFGSNPEQEMRDDLVRCKQVLESESNHKVEVTETKATLNPSIL